VINFELILSDLSQMERVIERASKTRGKVRFLLHVSILDTYVFIDGGLQYQNRDIWEGEDCTGVRKARKISRTF